VIIYTVPRAATHPSITGTTLSGPAMRQRNGAGLLADQSGALAPGIAGSGEVTVSSRSVERFREAHLVWSDCFIVSHRFECSFADLAAFQAWALSTRDEGSLAQRTATLSMQDGRLNIDHEKLAEEIDVPGPVFHATPQEPHNWGLWLACSVPAIAWWRDHRRPGEKLLVYAHHPNMTATLRLLGIPAEDVIAHDVLAGYRLRNMRVYRPGDMDFCLTEAECAVFGELVATARRQVTGTAARRIFVSRRTRSRQDDAPRVLVNEDALAEAFAALGFRVIDPDTMSVAAQIHAFAGAEAVAGLGGAGMFNALFCRPGTKLLSFEDSALFLEKHANLFASVGLDYGFVLGTALAADAGGVSRWQVDIPAAMVVARTFFGVPAA
jgi:hypothetical protein